jgi:hypothetical protein
MIMMHYYGVYGRNGVGVYTDWQAVKKSQPFIGGFKVKRFVTYFEAAEFAINGICLVYGSYDIRSEISESIFNKMNYMYYYSEINAFLESIRTGINLRPVLIKHSS